MRTPEQAREFAALAHEQAGCLYGGEPYTIHLDAVVAVMKEVGITDPDILMVGYLHDIIEDTPVTESDLRQKGYPEDVIEGVALCTDEPGHPNRKSRKRATYARVKEHLATGTRGSIIGMLAKWADRIANVRSCMDATDKIGLLAMYMNESEKFTKVYAPQKDDSLEGVEVRVWYMKMVLAYCAL